MFYPAKLPSLLAVVSVSLKKEVRGEGRGGEGKETGSFSFPTLSPAFTLCFFIPRATFVLVTQDLKETETTATQATSSCKPAFNPYISSGHFWNLDSLKRWSGACFFKCMETFLSPSAYFKIKTCSIVAQFLAHKPVNFASLTDSFIVSFSNYWNLNANAANINQLSGPEKFPGISRKRAQAPVTYTFLASRGCLLTRDSTVVPCNV